MKISETAANVPISGSKEKIYFLILLASIIVISPFFNGSNSSEGKLISESLLWALLAFSAFFFFQRDQRAISLTNLEKLAGVFLLFSIISAIFAVYAIDAWLAVGRIFLGGCLFHLARTTAEKDNKIINRLILLVVISGIVQVLFCLHQFFFTEWYAVTFPAYYKSNLQSNIRGGVLRTIGGFLNPNYLAGFLNICLALAASFLLFAKKKMGLFIASGLASVFLIAGVLLSGSKGGLVVLALTIGVLAFLKDRRVIWLLLLVVILLVLIPNPVRDGFLRAITADPYITMRPGIWGSAVSMTLDNPLVGSGPDNFRYLGHVHAPPTDFLLVNYSRFPRIAHNSILHSFAEFGLLGFAPMFLIILFFLWRSFKTIFSKAQRTEEFYILVGISTAFIGVLVHSMVDNVLNHKALMVILIILLASFVVILKRRNPGIFALQVSADIKISDVGKGVMILATTLFLTAFLYYQVITPYLYEKDMEDIKPEVEDMESKLLSGQGVEAQELLSLKESLLSMSEKYAGNLAVWRHLAKVEKAEYMAFGEFSSLLNARRYYELVVKNLNGNAYLEEYAQLTLLFELVQRGYPKTDEILFEMGKLARKAIRANPQRAIYYQAAATVERETGNLSEAKRLLVKATRLEPNFLRAWSDLALIAKIRGSELEFKKYEIKMKESIERISKEKKPEMDDYYAWQIISLPS